LALPLNGLVRRDAGVVGRIHHPGL